jgi:hypothetical protein
MGALELWRWDGDYITGQLKVRPRSPSRAVSAIEPWAASLDDIANHENALLYFAFKLHLTSPPQITIQSYKCYYTPYAVDAFEPNLMP